MRGDRPAVTLSGPLGGDDVLEVADTLTGAGGFGPGAEGTELHDVEGGAAAIVACHDADRPKPTFLGDLGRVDGGPLGSATLSKSTNLDRERPVPPRLSFRGDGAPIPDGRGVVVSELAVGGGGVQCGLSRILATKGRPREGECLGSRGGSILFEFHEPKRRPGLGSILTIQFGHRGRQPKPCPDGVTSVIGFQAGEIVRAADIGRPAGAAAHRKKRGTRKNGRLER